MDTDLLSDSIQRPLCHHGRSNRSGVFKILVAASVILAGAGKTLPPSYAETPRSDLPTVSLLAGRPAGFYHLESARNPEVCARIGAALNQPLTPQYGPFYDVQFFLGNEYSVDWTVLPNEALGSEYPISRATVDVFSNNSPVVVYRSYSFLAGDYHHVLYITPAFPKGETSYSQARNRELYSPQFQSGRWKGAPKNAIIINSETIRDLPTRYRDMHVLFNHYVAVKDFVVINNASYLLLSPLNVPQHPPIEVFAVTVVSQIQQDFLCHLIANYVVN